MKRFNYVYKNYESFQIYTKKNNTKRNIKDRLFVIKNNIPIKKSYFVLYNYVPVIKEDLR